MLSDERNEEKRGTKVPRTRRRKSQPARWGADWSSERSSYRVIEKAKGRNPLAELADTGHRRRKLRQQRCRTQDTEWRLFGRGDAGHRTLWTDVGRAEVGIKSRRNGRRRSGVWQTPATAKKKKPNGSQNWLHVHNACWRIGQHDSVAMLGKGEQTQQKKVDRR